MEDSITCGDPLPEATLVDGFCSQVVPASTDLSKPRSILSISQNDFLVLDRGSASVLRVYTDDNKGIPDKAVDIGAKSSGINHGLAYHDGYVYASSDSTVYRWKYEAGSNSVSGPKETIVVNIDKDGKGGAPSGHKTRTLIFDTKDQLYVSVGSADNVDEDSHRSRIRRMNVSDATTFPLDFQNAEVFADGLRNEVGLAFDRHQVLWGVENGADQLERDDIGGDIHNDNPAEELNRFPESMIGSNWGYPQCWSEYKLDDKYALGRRTQWSWPGFDDTSDKQCREEYIASELAMQAHSAPLGITFYNYSSTFPDGCSGAFPESMDGYAFIAFHGSWNRDIPTGYKVVYVPMTEDGMVENPSEDPKDLMRRDSSSTAKWTNGYRPVDVDFDECGRLLVTSDGTKNQNEEGENVVRISYGEFACCGKQSTGLKSNNGHVNGLFVSPSVMALFWVLVVTTLWR